LLFRWTEKAMTIYDSYASPFSWRYASPEMRWLWSETSKRLIWRQAWLALAKTQAEFGLVSPEQLADISAHVREVNIERALEIESQIRHDLMAELRTYAEQCPVGGGVLHLGATSMDIEDNADALRLRSALDLVLGQLHKLLPALADKIEQYADTPVMAFTHLQPAEPTTLGYRLASYAQDLLADLHGLEEVKESVRGKGFKGAVGTSASYAELFGVSRLAQFEAGLSENLGIPFFEIATQTYPRRQDYVIVSALAGLGAVLYKFAFDLRILQSPPIGELAEPFGRMQVGSSAMPFKRNPIQAEKVDSLARALAQMPAVAWHNAAHSLLERTLDDSANRRTLLPEAFLIVDELLLTTQKIVSGLQVQPHAIQRNLATYGPFASTERLLMALAKTGADRQEMHEQLRRQAMTAWDEVQNGRDNPLIARLAEDEVFLRYLTAEEIIGLMKVEDYVGDAPLRARKLAKEIRGLGKNKSGVAG
jgi:adenylosuccinate lyase